MEEPPGDTHLILTSQRLGALPPTIRSRCQTVAIARDPKVARIWLTGAKARALLSDYDGAPLLAAAGAAAGERPMADLLTELRRRTAQRTAQLLEELLALDRRAWPPLAALPAGCHDPRRRSRRRRLGNGCGAVAALAAAQFRSSGRPANLRLCG